MGGQKIFNREAGKQKASKDGDKTPRTRCTQKQQKRGTGTEYEREKHAHLGNSTGEALRYPYATKTATWPMAPAATRGRRQQAVAGCRAGRFEHYTGPSLRL
jgi:hypothetical protein